MSFDRRASARRLPPLMTVDAFDWGSPIARAAQAPAADAPPEPPPAPRMSTAEIERDAFAKGYANGERAGAEAAATRGEAMLRRLAQTLDELASLRAEMVRKTERQLVELALALARRIVHREVTLDRELLVAMARVAIDRLGDRVAATVRLHPDDFAMVSAGGASGGSGPAPGVTVVADPRVSAGGCLVESDFGLIDVSIDAQLSELAAALLGEESPSATGTSIEVLERAARG